MNMNKVMFKLREKFLQLLLRPVFMTDDVTIGRGTVIGRSVRFNCKKVVLGDGVRIGEGCIFDCESLMIGDFATIYPGCFFPGPGSLSIGHNFWLGANSIIDSQGGTTIGNNVGVGAHSHLWTHMKFGDVAAGCRFHSMNPLVIDNDAWLVGHVLVSPVHIGARSLVMLGSLVAKDIPADRIFAGSPAKDMTEKFGPQFRQTSIDERREYVSDRIERIACRVGISKVWSSVKLVDEYYLTDATHELIINLADRTYKKNGTDFERLIIRSLLPDAKFTPV